MEVDAEAHAQRRGLLPITERNASQYPPPSLNKFRTKASRAPGDCKPALWYWQMTTEEWDRDGHSYELAKKQWRRLLSEYRQQEKQREQQRSWRDRTGRVQSAANRRKQRNEQVRRVQTEAAIAARRAAQPWHDRRDLFRDLLRAAGLPTRHLIGACSHLYASSNFSCS